MPRVTSAEPGALASTKGNALAVLARCSFVGSAWERPAGEARPRGGYRLGGSASRLEKHGYTLRGQDWHIFKALELMNE